MIDLKLTEEQLDELHKEATENPCMRARKKCWVVYLKGKGYAHQEIADVVRVEGDTVTAYLRKVSVHLPLPVMSDFPPRGGYGKL